MSLKSNLHTIKEKYKGTKMAPSTSPERSLLHDLEYNSPMLSYIFHLRNKFIHA